MFELEGVKNCRGEAGRQGGREAGRRGGGEAGKQEGGGGGNYRLPFTASSSNAQKKL